MVEPSTPQGESPRGDSPVDKRKNAVDLLGSFTGALDRSFQDKGLNSAAEKQKFMVTAPKGDFASGHTKDLLKDHNTLSEQAKAVVHKFNHVFNNFTTVDKLKGGGSLDKATRARHGNKQQVKAYLLAHFLENTLGKNHAATKEILGNLKDDLVYKKGSKIQIPINKIKQFLVTKNDIAETTTEKSKPLDNTNIIPDDLKLQEDIVTFPPITQERPVERPAEEESVEDVIAPTIPQEETRETPSVKEEQPTQPTTPPVQEKSVSEKPAKSENAQKRRNRPARRPGKPKQPQTQTLVEFITKLNEKPTENHDAVKEFINNIRDMNTVSPISYEEALVHLKRKIGSHVVKKDKNEEKLSQLATKLLNHLIARNLISVKKDEQDNQ